MEEELEPTASRDEVVRCRLAHGICRKCGKAKALSGSVLCTKCKEHRDRLRAWLDAQHGKN